MPTSRGGDPSRPLTICVLHRRMADAIGSAIRGALPDTEVSIERDPSRDPARIDEIEVLVANTFPPGLLGRMPRLRWLQLTGVGVDHVAGGKPPNDLLVTHAGAIPATAVAEFAWLGILTFAKEGLLLAQNRRERRWPLPDARLVRGSTVVLLGLGNIGKEVARIGKGFGARLIAVTRSAASSPLVDDIRPLARLRETAREADYLVIAVPGSRDATNLVDASVIEALPANAALINVARGSVLDIEALVRALSRGRLRGALIDAHEQEPLPADSPLWSTERLWITPHCAFQYPEQASDLAALVIDNIGRFRSGRPLRNVADRGSWWPASMDPASR